MTKSHVYVFITFFTAEKGFLKLPSLRVLCNSQEFYIAIAGKTKMGLWRENRLPKPPRNLELPPHLLQNPRVPLALEKDFPSLLQRVSDGLYKLRGMPTGLLGFLG